MSQVVIAGCGYVGNALAEKLTAEGHEVFGIRRDISKLVPEFGASKAISRNLARSVRPRGASSMRSSRVGADESSEKAYRKAYVDGLAGFLEWLADEGQRPKRIVMTSSTSVYGQRRGEPIDEDSPTHPTHFRGETLLTSERLLGASGLSSVVVRLGGIYGPGRTSLIDRARAGSLRLRESEHFTNRIHRDDAAGLMRHLLFHESPAPLYLGVDNESAEEASVYRWLADAVGGTAPEPSDPEAPRTPRRDVGSKRCSNRLARGSGYEFRYPTFREGYGDLIRATRDA